MRRVTKALAAVMLMTSAVFAVGCNPEENNDSDVKVTTYTPQDITGTTAVCGGDVIVTQGLSLTEFGVCWGTSGKPTVEDSHLLPAAGYRRGDELNRVGSYGYYWSSSLDTDDPIHAWNFYFNSDYYYVHDHYRYYGRSVRAVRSARQN